MRVALFSNMDNGGAGNAVVRLHQGLNKVGVDSTLFVKYKTVDIDKIIPVGSSEIDDDTLGEFIQSKFFNHIYEGNTICTAMYPGIRADWLEKNLAGFDIVNLHWIPQLVSVENIERIRRMNKPVVWTLHDQNAMTGACHYTHGCNKYHTDCALCPQMKNQQFDLPKMFLSDKMKKLPKDMVLISPSRWLADCARESAVFHGYRIEVVPYSLDTDIYKPTQNSLLKSQLNIPPKARVLLFGANSFKEKRKGVRELIEAANYLKDDDYIKSLLDKNELYILTFGDEGDTRPLDDLGIPYLPLGYINDETKLAEIYSSADVLILPSMEDNLPNILLESLACGTPIVAFNIGGMPDVIENGKNGYIVSLGDTKALSARIIDVLQGKLNERSHAGSAEEYCRNFALKNYCLTIQARRYKELFQELLLESKESSDIIFSGSGFEISVLKYLAQLDRELEQVKQELKYKCLVDSIGPRKLFLWGGGNLGRKAINIFQRINCQVSGFIDTNPAKQGQLLESTVIYSPEEVLTQREDKPFVFITSTVYAAQIQQQLEEKGYLPERDFKMYT